MSINWEMGLMPNIGANALAAFQQGRQIRQQQETQNAMADFVTNPNDAGALDRVTRLDPKMGMALRERLSAQQAEEAKKRVGMMGDAAQWADTPEKWDQAIDYLAQQGVDVAQYKGKFSPELRMSAIASAGELKSYLERTAPVNVGPGSHLVDPATGKAVFSAPFAPRPVTVKDGETVVEYAPGAGADTGSIIDRIAGIEGTGRNPKSSAIGYGQFIDSTFVDTFRKAFPERAGLSNEQILAQRGTGVERPMLEKLTADNTAALQSAGIQPTPGNTYLAHFLGSTGAIQTLQSDPNTPLASIVGDKVIAANPFLRGMTAADVKAWADKKMGGQPSRVIAQGGPKQAEQWRTMTPEEAQGMGLPPGMVYQRSPSGEIKPIGGQPKAALTAQQTAAVKQKLNDTLQIENQLARVEKAMTAAEEKGWVGYVGGRVPGGLDAESDTFDKSVRLLATMVRKLTRTPGEGAMSDYESRLAEMTLPSRTDTKEGRREALAGIRELIASIKMGYGELAGSASSQPAPAAKGGWGKAKVVQ